MSDHEIFKLKKELVACRKVIEQQKNELKIRTASIINLEEDADFAQNQAKGLAEQVRRLVEQLHEKDKMILNENPGLKERLQRDLLEKEEHQQQEITAHRKTKVQLDAAETQLQIWKDSLRQAAIKHNDDTIEQDAENYRDEVLINRLKVQNLVEKSNQMSQALEQLSAENRVLRKMAGVPDDYQFEVNDIVQEGQLQVEKYRSQVRALEEEVEELEEERARLRRRLRDNQIGGETGAIDVDDAVSRKASKQQILELTQRCKQYEEELYHLKMGGKTINHGKAGNTEGFEELIKQNTEMKDQLSEFMRQVQQGQTMQGDQTGNKHKSINLSAFQQYSQAPTPLPGAFGNYNDIKDGVSNRFKTKLPVDMAHMQGEQVGLDEMQVKFEMASLQLQNMETLKLLQEKEKEYSTLQNEVDEIKEDIRKKFLLVQDELFMTHHREKCEWITRFGDLKVKHTQQSEQLAYQKVEIDKYTSYMHEVERRDPSSVQSKLAEMTKRSAILDVNLIKLSRKYESLQEEYKQIKMSFIEQQSEYIEKERDLLEKIYNLIGWKKNTTAQMKLMLTSLQNSVPLETHHILRSEKEQSDERLANSELKVSEFTKRVAKLEGAERDVFEKDDKIRALEEELIEVQLEEEVIKKRLEALDPYFRKFQTVYVQMVDFIKLRNISPLEMFKNFDQNGDGKIQKTEFQTAIRDMGIPIDNDEMDVLYMFVDLDGTGEIEYQEFVRKLRRSGVTVRKKEDELLFTLYKAIRDTGLSLRSAFETFDTNGDNIISKQDMKEVLDEMRLNVEDAVIDYIFKIADTSGDNQISYDEFTNLFEGIVKNQIQEDSKMVVGELDWKMAVMVQIDGAVKAQNLTLLDAFKMIDRDDNQTVSLREFGAMFEGMGIQLPDTAIKDLFSQMDKNRNGEISYNEMLNYLRQSKLEDDKLKKLKFIQERTQLLREQTDHDINLQSLGQNTVLTIESRLQMKVAILEMRQKNGIQRSQLIIQQLGYSDGMVKDLNKQLLDCQHQIERSNDNFFKQKAENVGLQQRVQGAISRQESEKIKRSNEMQKLEIIDLKSALTTYRNLYDTAVTQTKIMRITIEKIKNDHDTLQLIIKELQSASDQNAIIGKLYHHVMISRWNEGQTNARYEKLLDELRRLKLEEASYEAILKDRQEELHEQTSLFRETILSYEKQVTELKGKLLPTVTLQRVEEQANRIREIAEMKFEVEKQNRQLREKFYELQLKADYFDIYKGKLDELEQRLKKSNPDELSQQIIEVSEKYSECKIESLKAQRDLTMAQEKEQYYQRLNRQYTDNIKKLEFDLANSDLTLRKREEDWRRKFYEQRKTIFSQLGVQDEGVSSKPNAVLLKHQQQQTKTGASDAQKKNIQISELEYHGFKATIEAQESEIKKKNMEIEGLINRQHIQTTGGGSQVYNAQQLEHYTKDILTQEVERLSQAAQQTIKCLQDMIRDKDTQVDRKEAQIELVKKEAMMHKKRDLEQIQQLNDLLHQRGHDRITEQINIPQHQSFMQDTSPVMMESYQLKLREKDARIKELELGLEGEHRALKKIKEDCVRILNEKEQLQGELMVEAKRNETEQYRKQVESLQKLVKSKTKELVTIKSTVTALKTEVFKVAEEGVTKEQAYNTKECRMSATTTEMEMKMKHMLNEVKQLKKDIKTKHEEVDLVRMQEIELKAKVTDLVKVNQDLKSLIQQSGGRSSNNVEDQVQTLTSKLQQTNQLQIENATMLKEIQFLKSQGQAKNLFDKDGNLQSQNNSIYFKNVEELCEAIRMYLTTKPRVNLLQEFERNDRDKKRVVSFTKFFEVLSMVGLKFKTRDLKLLQDAVKVDKGDVNADYYHQFYYKVKNIQDGEMQASDQQTQQSVLAYGKK